MKRALVAMVALLASGVAAAQGTAVPWLRLYEVTGGRRTGEIGQLYYSGGVLYLRADDGTITALGAGGGGGAWGAITGTLGDQTDLDTALDAKQPLDADLTTIAGAITAAGHALLDDANAAAQRTTLSLGNVDNTADTAKPVSTAQQTALDGKQNLDADLTSIAALTTTAFGRGLLDDADAAAGRSSLSLGTAATSATGDFAAASHGVHVTDSDKGDITVGTAGTAYTIDAGVVTLAKMANLAQDQFIGRTTASTGVPETATITSAARGVLDDTTTANMLASLGGQTLDATLTALAGLNATAGVVEQTGADAFTKRAFGVAASTDVLTRADGDGRFGPIAVDYLVGTANASLTGEIVVGTAPGGELGGTWATPTLDDTVTVDAWTLGASFATTAAANDSDTSLATTAFVQAEIDDADLLSDNCVLENDATPIPDSCVGDGSDAGGGGGLGHQEVMARLAVGGGF